MKVFDAHIHVQPWHMVKPEVLAMIDDESHANAKDVLASMSHVSDGVVDVFCGRCTP